jgi:L-rhamnose mutarotase
MKDKKILSHNSKKIIENIVARLHVSASNDDVVKKVFSKINPKMVKTLSDAQLKEIADYAIYAHQKNFALYAYVLGGR